MSEGPILKPLIWVASSHDDLCAFPEPLQDSVGYALYVAQCGGKHRDAKTLRGFGDAGVLEVVRDFHCDIFRTVYAVRLASAVYVLHAFQKKSKAGRETPQQDVELIKQRLRAAKSIEEDRTK